MKRNIRETKPQPAVDAPETDVLSDLRVSDEPATLPSDLCCQQSKGGSSRLNTSPPDPKTDFHFWSSPGC